MEKKFEQKKEYLKKEKDEFTDLQKVIEFEKLYTKELEKIKDKEYM